MNAEQLEQAVDLLEKEDEMECHWSPYCTREGAEYVTVHIGDQPHKVWVCDQCMQFPA